MRLPVHCPGDSFDIDIGEGAEEVRHSFSLEKEAEPGACKRTFRKVYEAVGFNHFTLAIAPRVVGEGRRKKRCARFEHAEDFAECALNISPAIRIKTYVFYRSVETVIWPGQPREIANAQIRCKPL